MESPVMTAPNPTIGLLAMIDFILSYHGQTGEFGHGAAVSPATTMSIAAVTLKIADGLPEHLARPLVGAATEVANVALAQLNP
jgi:hypothetical protein